VLGERRRIANETQIDGHAGGRSQEATPGI
jgi:hypothetical protein